MARTKVEMLVCDGCLKPIRRDQPKATLTIVMVPAETRRNTPDGHDKPVEVVTLDLHGFMDGSAPRSGCIGKYGKQLWESHGKVEAASKAAEESQAGAEAAASEAYNTAAVASAAARGVTLLPERGPARRRRNRHNGG